MQRQPTGKRSVKRPQRRLVKVNPRRPAAIFGRAAHSNSSPTLSAKARLNRQPLLVSEDALRKLQLSGPGRSVRRRRYGFQKPAGLAALVVTAGLLIAIAAWHIGRFSSGGSRPAPTNAAGTDGLVPTLGLPSEKPPVKDYDSFNGLKVAFDQPKRLVIDKLGVSSQIRSLGTGDYNRLMFPGNIYDVGWYNKSSLPGGKSTVLLDAYASGSTKQGVLFSVDRLNPGDRISIIRGDGVKFNYRISSRQIYQNQQGSIKDLLNAHRGSSQNLVLAVSQAGGGSGGSQYKQWIVVKAELE